MSQSLREDPEKLPKVIANSIDMKLALIPAGAFFMGTPRSRKGGRDNIRHQVRINKPFYLGVYEVTQEEYEQVMRKNPSAFRTVQGLDTKCFPVEMTTWNDAVEFCRKLSARSQEHQVGRRYRLPTEAEWEYACREGGRKVRFCNSSDLANPSEMNFNGSAEEKEPYSVAGEYLEETTPAESFPPNSLGLYDMSGNVWEWTCSEYQDRYDGSEERCADQADRYSLRGGSWGSFPWGVRAAYRNHHLLPASRNDHIGFRLARDN